MRLLVIACSLLLAGCGLQAQTVNGADANVTVVNWVDLSDYNTETYVNTAENMVESDPREWEEVPPPEPLPERCVPSAFYADGKVPPDFYEWGNPQFADYRYCLQARAAEAGTEVRLATPEDFPRIGTCYATRVLRVYGPHGNPTDRTAIAYENGISQYGYEPVDAVRRSRPGDRVRICVIDLPQDCPADDLRGIGYRTTNLRTRETWELGNSQHVCRGA